MALQIYVTDVAGLHSGVNPVSGPLPGGATGRLIEGGALAAPLAVGETLRLDNRHIVPALPSDTTLVIVPTSV